MEQNKDWIHNRKIQLFALAVLLNTYLVFAVLFPALEEIPYYETKIDRLDQTKQILETYVLHIDYYSHKSGQTSQRVNSYRNQFKTIKDPSFLPVFFNTLQQKHHVKVISQGFEISNKNPDLFQVNISQSLEGNFHELSQYLESFALTNKYLIIVNCRFINNSPLEKDPLLTLEIELKCILPKVI
ncbi:hypothetical protein KJ966_24440 [bacterium]|nr:hypothetical protein [bacterium]